MSETNNCVYFISIFGMHNKYSQSSEDPLNYKKFVIIFCLLTLVCIGFIVFITWNIQTEYKPENTIIYVCIIVLNLIIYGIIVIAHLYITYIMFLCLFRLIHWFLLLIRTGLQWMYCMIQK